MIKYIQLRSDIKSDCPFLLQIDILKIFVSYPLFDLFALHRNINFIADDMRQIAQLYGIPVQPYKCEECEFYLAERKGKFRKEIDGAELYFKEGDTE